MTQNDVYCIKASRIIFDLFLKTKSLAVWRAGRKGVSWGTGASHCIRCESIGNGAYQADVTSEVVYTSAIQCFLAD